MAVSGLGLILWAGRTRVRAGDQQSIPPPGNEGTWAQRVALALLLVAPLVIPSDWTQDIPRRYGKRHEGLSYSRLYPRIPPRLL